MIDSIAAAVDRVLDAIHGEVVFSAALDIGKSDLLVNAPYRRRAARMRHPLPRRGGRVQWFMRGS